MALTNTEREELEQLRSWHAASSHHCCPQCTVSFSLFDDAQQHADQEAAKKQTSPYTPQPLPISSSPVCKINVSLTSRVEDLLEVVETQRIALKDLREQNILLKAKLVAAEAQLNQPLFDVTPKTKVYVDNRTYSPKNTVAAHQQVAAAEERTLCQRTAKRHVVTNDDGLAVLPKGKTDGGSSSPSQEEKEKMRTAMIAVAELLRRAVAVRCEKLEKAQSHEGNSKKSAEEMATTIPTAASRQTQDERCRERDSSDDVSALLVKAAKIASQHLLS